MLADTFILDINLIFIILIAVGVGILLSYFLLFIFFISFKYRGREKNSVDSVLLEVAITRGNEIKIDAMEQMFATLYSIKKSGWKQKFSVQPTVSFEIVGRPEDIRFYVWTPTKFRDLIEKQIHGAYPDAQILEVSEYNLFNEEGKVAYKSFQLSKANYLPLKTFRELPTDPLSSITSALAKMQEGESAAIQVLISPAESDWQKEGRNYISETKKQESDPEKAKFSVGAKTLEAVENKTAKPGFETSVRVVVVSTTSESAKAHLANVSSALSQFASEFNNLGGRKIRRKGAFMEDFLYRYQPMFNLWGNHTTILNSEELATIFHFPNKTVTTPNIFWLNAKTAPAPAEIPSSGLYMGESSYRGIKKPVYMSEDDRRRHIYIIGATGVGKSEFLKELIMQDIKEGKGVCFIDPHDTIDTLILPNIPPERAEDVIYFYPGDTERPMGINLLEAKNEDEQHFISTSVINLMYKLFDPYKTGIVGPRFEHGIRNAMLTVMQALPGGTFVEVVQAMQRSEFVRDLLPNVKDPIVKRYWTDQIAQTSDFHKSEVLDYTVSKFGRFVTNKMIRNMIGQSQSSFDFRKVMDEGKILLINLAKGEIGEENSSFLGLILVPRILMAAMSRQDIPQEERRDFYLYVDEFQNFATPDFAQILSEARKYRLNLTVANQFIGQIEEEVKNAIFGNVGTKIAFRVGVTDANYLAHEFAPVFNEEDLLNVERFHAFVKTIVRNDPVPPFSMDLTKDPQSLANKGNPRIAQIIKEMSRLKFGRDARLVEAEIARRAKL